MTKKSLSMTQMSRAQILNAPVAHPGMCVVCHSARSDDRDYIDFNFDIDYYGTVYFCTLCFAEIAFNCGFIRSEEVNDLIIDNKSLKSEVNRLNAKNGILNATLRDCFNNGIQPDVDTIGYVSAIEAEGPSAVESSRETIVPASSPNEPTVSKGPDRVHDNTKSNRRKSESSDINDIFS